MSEPKILEIEKQHKRETGIEAKTNEFVDGKQVYVKRFSCGDLPTINQIDYGMKDIESGFNFNTEIDIIKLEGIAKSKTTGAIIPMNYANPIASENIALRTRSTNLLSIYVGIDRSDYEGFVDMYYTKK